MVVYIEYVLLSNFLIDAFVAYLTLVSLRMRASRLRICLASAFGAAFAAAVPYINFPAAGAVKVLMLLLMTAVMSKYTRFRQFLLATLLYFVYTAALGGLVLMIRNLSLSDFISAMYYPGDLTGAYLAAGAIVLLYAIRQAVGYTVNKRRTGSRECKVILEVQCGEVACEGLIDTGNTLLKGGKGVIVIDGKLAQKLVKKGATRTGGIWVKTVSGECYLPTIALRSVAFPQEKGRRVYDVTAAISQTALKDFRVILPAGI